MTYAPAPPSVAPPPAEAPRRPVPVRLAAVLLAVMALIGLGYAVTTLAVTPGVVSRFRDAAAGADSTDVDGYVTVVWTMAAIGAVLAVVLFALYIVLALGLRRGSNGSRVATWVVCGLGLLVGCGSAVTVGAQRAGDGTPGTLGFALTSAYPGSWIELNVGLMVAQMLGYLVVGMLLVMSPGEFFGRGQATSGRQTAYVALPTYGGQTAVPTFPPAYPQSGGYPAYPHTPPSGFPAQPGYPAADYPTSAAPSASYSATPPGGHPPVSAEDHAAWARPAPSAPETPPAPHHDHSPSHDTSSSDGSAASDGSSTSD